MALSRIEVTVSRDHHERHGLVECVYLNGMRVPGGTFRADAYFCPEAVKQARDYARRNDGWIALLKLSVRPDIDPIPRMILRWLLWSRMCDRDHIVYSSTDDSFNAAVVAYRKNKAKKSKAN